MSHRWIGTAAVAVIALHAPDTEAVTFVGFKADTFCCGAASRLRLDWSSDFGPDYTVSTAGENAGGPNFQPSEVWPYGELHSSDSVTMHLERFLSGSLLSADGEIAIGPAGTPSPGTVHTFSHRLGSTAGTGTLYGFSMSSSLGGDFFFSGIDAEHPLYWGVEWTLTIANPAASSGAGLAELTLNDAKLNPPPLPGGALGASRTMSGAAFGSQSAGRFRIISDGALTANPFAPDELAWEVRVAFSASPFSDIPDAVATPEPAALGLLLLGLAALVRRQA